MTPINCSEPCELAKALAASASHTVKGIYMDGEIIPTTFRFKRCPLGITAKQAVNLHVWASWQGIIVSARELADQLSTLYEISTTRVAVRNTMDTLRHRGFFTVCEYGCEGFRQGMLMALSAKCCCWLLPHTPPHTIAAPPALPSSHTASHPSAIPPDTEEAFPLPSSSAETPLLQEREEDEEEGRHRFDKEEQERLLNETFKEFEQTAPQKWPFLLKRGFSYALFVNAGERAKSKELFLKTWRESLNYAEYDAQHNHSLKDLQGVPIKSFGRWVAGCFAKSSSYDPPQNYRTPEDLAQEAAQKAVQEAEKQRCTAAYAKWRRTVPESELRNLFADWGLRFPPPENVIEERFEKRIWPEMRKQKMHEEGLKQAMVSYDETACPAGPKTDGSPSSS